jgi:hypothetical protein
MGLSKSESSFVLSWAKRIKAIKLLGGKCRNCNADNIFVLEFHHIEKSKEKLLRKIKSYRWSFIEEEIKKCILLCSNCHAELHCTKNRNHKEKKKILDKIERYSCSKCNYKGKNYASLVFHHNKGIKNFGISKVTTRQVNKSLDDVLNEIKNNCVLICKNCHLKEHILIEKFNKLKSYIDYRIENHQEYKEPLNADIIYDMLTVKGMNQTEIAKYFGRNKSVINGIIKRFEKK